MPHPKQTLYVVFDWKKHLLKKYMANELRNHVYVWITSHNETKLLS